MAGKDDLVVDYGALRNISVKSLARGTSKHVLEATLIKIGLTKEAAKKVVKQAGEEIRKKRG